MPSRDHSERMLKAAGAELSRAGRTVAIAATERLHGGRIAVPADFSSAAFFLVGALLVPGSDVTLTGVGLNPTRTGLLTILERMGAEVEATVEGERGGEPAGTVRARAARLRGTEIGGGEVPLAIDELPLVGARRLLRRGDDDDRRRGRAAPQGVRPGRHGHGGAAGARRPGRGDRGRDGHRGDRRARRRRGRGARRPPDRDARRDRRASPPPRGSRSTTWGRRRSATPASRPISPLWLDEPAQRRPARRDRLGEGPTIVFVHGSIVGAELTWRRQLLLAERWPLTIPNRPGFGASPALPRNDFEVEAGLFAELLGDGAHLVGHSYGAVIALLAAAERPEAVLSLTVSEPGALKLAGTPEGRGDDRRRERLFAARDSISPADFLRFFRGGSGLEPRDS